MKIKEVVNALERFAPLPLQDSYDNAGMQIGLTEVVVSGVLLCLDVTESVIDEAVALGYNMIISHHPLIFSGCKSLTGKSMVERCIVKAIKNEVVIYSAHTNLDNALNGVSFKMAEKLGMTNVRLLKPLAKDVEAGAGVIGELRNTMNESDFLQLVKRTFGVSALMHNATVGRPIRMVALCGGAGSFLSADAEAVGADAFVTGEVKYHDFFDHDGLLLVAIGHYESEQFTMELIKTIIGTACPELPTRITRVNTNPINYM